MRILDCKETDLFRAEVRAWLEENAPKARRPPEGIAMREYDRAWQRVQYDAGWAGLAWPIEYGGRGLPLIQQMIWAEEYVRAGAPQNSSMFIGLNHAGPTLIVSGTEEQKRFHLPRILSGEAQWCQGFSEPGAGSDLGALSTRAEIDGDTLVINGSKIWTANAHLADYQELLARTGAGKSKYEGISWIIGDMHAPGITIRPIPAMSGLTHLCQVFYDDVRLPLSNIVGPVNEGWRVAMTTLGFERGTATLSHQLELAETVERLIDINKRKPRHGMSSEAGNETSSSELAALKSEVLALRSMTVMSISRGMHTNVPGPEGNIVALFFAELARRVYAVALKLLGPLSMERAAIPSIVDRDWPTEYFESYKWGIGGGTCEIRRNTIAERVLGLPKLRSP